MSTVMLPSSSRRGAITPAMVSTLMLLFCGQAFFADEFDKRARAVAALFHFAAIVVIDAVAEIAAGQARFFHHQDLVGADAETAVGQALPLLRREIDLLADGVDDDEVIAGAVHLGKVQFHAVSVLFGLVVERGFALRDAS